MVTAAAIWNAGELCGNFGMVFGKDGLLVKRSINSVVDSAAIYGKLL